MNELFSFSVGGAGDVGGGSDVGGSGVKALYFGGSGGVGNGSGDDAFIFSLGGMGGVGDGAGDDYEPESDNEDKTILEWFEKVKWNGLLQ